MLCSFSIVSQSFAAEITQADMTDELLTRAQADYITGGGFTVPAGEFEYIVNDYALMAPRLKNQLNDDFLLQLSKKVNDTSLTDLWLESEKKLNPTTYSVIKKMDEISGANLMEEHPEYYDEMVILSVLAYKEDNETINSDVDFLNSKILKAWATANNGADASVSFLNMAPASVDWTFLKDVKELQLASDVSQKIVDVFVKTSSTSEEMMNRISLYKALKDVQSRDVIFMKQVKRNCNDECMKKALDNVIYGFENIDDDALINKLCTQGYTETLHTCAKALMDCVIEFAIGESEISAIYSSAQTLTGLSDILASTGTILDYYGKAERLAIFETACTNAAKNAKNYYIGARNSANAEILLGGNDVLYNMVCYDIDFYCEFARLFPEFQDSGSSYDELNSNANSLKQTFLNNQTTFNNIDWVTWVNDFAEYYPKWTGVNLPVISSEHTLLPDYVKNGDTVYTLFNPDKARFLLGISQDVYNENNPFFTLESYGFADRQFILRGVNVDTNLGESHWYNSMTAVTGVKRIEANDKTRYVIAIGIQGTSEGSIADILTDVNMFKKDGDHYGFYNNAGALYNAAYNGSIMFNIDGESVSLGQIIDEACHEDSKYSFIITGHSLGAATADMFAGRYLKDKGVLPQNYEVYTFEAPSNCTRNNMNNYGYKNIFNILNYDDPVAAMPSAEARYGGDIYYTPTETERQKCYGSSYVEGKDSSYYRGFFKYFPSEKNWIPHNNTITCPVILESIISNIDSYVQYSTLTFKGGSGYILDAIKDWEFDELNIGSLTVYDKGVFCVNNDLTIYRSCYVDGILAIGGDMNVCDGTVNINGIVTVNGNYNHSAQVSHKYTKINAHGKLKVSGDFLHYSSATAMAGAVGQSFVYVYGSLIINGNYKTSGHNSSEFCSLILSDENSYMEVLGDFIYDKTNNSSNFKDGLICIGGNYKNNSNIGNTLFILIGDINNDNEKDSLDATLILKYIEGIYAFDDIQKTKADYNRDGSIDLIDAISILQRIS